MQLQAFLRLPFNHEWLLSNYNGSVAVCGIRCGWQGMEGMEPGAMPWNSVHIQFKYGVKGVRYLGFEYGWLLTNTAKLTPRMPRMLQYRDFGA